MVVQLFNKKSDFPLFRVVFSHSKDTKGQSTGHCRALPSRPSWLGKLCPARVTRLLVGWLVGHLWPVFAGKNGAEASDLGPAHNLPAHFADRDMAISWMFTDVWDIP